MCIWQIRKRRFCNRMFGVCKPSPKRKTRGTQAARYFIIGPSRLFRRDRRLIVADRVRQVDQHLFRANLYEMDFLTVPVAQDVLGTR